MLPYNPSRSVELPRPQQGGEERLKAMSPEEACSFLEAAREDRLYCLFSFALATGMRPGEYLAVRWEDVYWEDGRVLVRRTLYRPRGGGWRFEDTKTRGSRRCVDVPRRVLEELAEHRTEQNQIRELLGEAYDDHDLVFANDFGQPLDLSNLRKRHFVPIARAAGLDGRFNVYSLRHTHASLLLAAGVNVKVISERLGHASVRLTLDIYSHVMPTMQRDAADRLEEILYPQLDEPELDEE